MGDYLATNAVHIGSVLDLAGRLEPGSVQTIVTSPPYFGLRSYLDAAHPDKAHELGGEATPEGFVANLVAVFAALRPALKEDGTMWVNLGDSYARDGGTDRKVSATAQAGGTRAVLRSMGDRTSRAGSVPPKSLLMIPHRVALALQADGWVIRSDIVWAKPNPMPESVTDRPTRSHEYIFLISKGPAYFYDATAIAEAAAQPVGIPRRTGQHKAAELGAYRGMYADTPSSGLGTNQGATTRNKRSVWTVPSAAFPDAHYATFPPDLIRPCVLAGTSERGECSACGKAWVRCVEKVAVGIPASHRGSTFTNGKTAVPHPNVGQGSRYEARPSGEWRPQCACDAPTRPQIVLDPFMGSGTTAEVAHEEGRRWVGLDLDERAVRWTADRLARLPVGRLFA